MTAAATRKPVIPEPDGWSMVLGAARTMLSVDVDGVTAVYFYDTCKVTLSLVDSSERLSATDLDNAICKQRPPGRVVFTGRIDCGGGLSARVLPKVTGTPAEVGTLLKAIPYFYQDIQATEERKTMRAVYRYLQNAACIAR